MTWIRTHKILSWAIAIYAALVLFALIAGSGGSWEPAPLPDLPSTSTSSTAAQATTGSEFERPNFEQLDCRSLLTTDEVDLALASTAWIETSRGESCLSQLLEDSEVFVQIGPGQPNEFQPGAELIGVTGQPVPGVGDIALWFGGTQAQGDGDAGVLSVAQQTPLGALIFRIVLSRPDLASAQQLELAKAVALSALPRFPGVQLPPPPPPDPVTVTFEHDPVDRSHQGFVENLLAREADGEWTRGAGLVATLRYLAGELESIEVLRHPDLLDASGTGILRMAQQYLETGDDSDAIQELQRLLDLLLVGDVREATAGARTPDPRNGIRSMALATQESDDCFYPYPDHGNPCFYPNLPAPQFGDKYLFLVPLLDEGETQWEGWILGPSTIRDAIRKSAIQLESMSGSMPEIEVWLAPFQGNSWVALDSGLCTIQLNRGAQALRDQDPALLQQAVAATMARCYIELNFGLSEQWESPLSWYLSDVVYPTASMETVFLKVPTALQSEELATTLLQRSLTNMTFFEFLDAAVGLEGTIGAVGTIAGSSLKDVSGIDDHLHEYNKALTDGVILDQAGAHGYGPPADFTALTEGVTISTSPTPFGVERIRVSVDGSDYACLEYPDGGNLDIFASWREGAPGESGTWTESLPSSVQGQGVFLLTTTESGGQFRIKVTGVDEEPDCEEEEESSNDTPGEPCGFCDPTEFFWRWTIAGVN